MSSDQNNDALSTSPDAEGDGLNFIEQLHAKAGENCSNPFAPLLIGMSKKHKNEAFVTKASCKSWSCPECSARMGKKWIAIALDHINKTGGDWYFMTLTSHKKVRTPRGSKKVLAHGWRKLSLRMKRAYGRFDYLRVWELHKDGAYHHHYILNCPIPHKRYYDSRKKQYRFTCNWLKKNASECGMGYMCDFRPIYNPAFVAGYVAKYTLKQAAPDVARHWVKGTRRIETSLSWSRLPKDETYSQIDWQLIGNVTSLEYWYEQYTKAGIDLYPTWLKGKKLTYEYFAKNAPENMPEDAVKIDWRLFNE